MVSYSSGHEPQPDTITTPPWAKGMNQVHLPRIYKNGGELFLSLVSASPGLRERTEKGFDPFNIQDLISLLKRSL